MLAELMHTFDRRHMELGLPQDRAVALPKKQRALLDLSVTTQLLPDGDDAALLARLEDLGRENTDVA